MDFPRLSAEQRSLLEQATSKYEAALEGSPAISYLEERGIPKEVASGFRLGYVEEPETGHEHTTGRLAIPYLTPCGVVDIKFRQIEESDGGDKYIAAGGGISRQHLYNAGALHEPVAQMAICEGELDALVLSALCGIPAVAVAGVRNWARHFRYCFSDYQVVWILMDPDEPGRDAAKKLRTELNNGVIIRLPADVNETYLEHGSDYIRKALGL